jgi:hypothetical protein
MLWHHTRASGPQPSRAWPAGTHGWWVAGDDWKDPSLASETTTRGTLKQIWRLTPDGELDQTVPPNKFKYRMLQDFQPLPDGSLAVFSRAYFRDMDVTHQQYTRPPSDPVTAQIFAPGGREISKFGTFQSSSRSLLSAAMTDGTILTTLGDMTTLRKIVRDGRTSAPFTGPAWPPLGKAGPGCCDAG